MKIWVDLHECSVWDAGGRVVRRYIEPEVVIETRVSEGYDNRALAKLEVKMTEWLKTALGECFVGEGR